MQQCIQPSSTNGRLNIYIHFCAVHASERAARGHRNRVQCLMYDVHVSSRRREDESCVLFYQHCVLVPTAPGPHPFPFRTRQLSSDASMVVWHAPCKSRSAPRQNAGKTKPERESQVFLSVIFLMLYFNKKKAIVIIGGKIWQPKF